MTSSPLWRGGGRIFPNLPEENFSHKINKKMYRAGMAAIFSQLARDGRLAVVDSITIDAPKTKLLAAKLKALNLDHVLVIADEVDENLFLAARNLPNVLVVDPALGVGSVAELVQLLRARPGQLNYGSVGNGSAAHLAMELFKARAGVSLVHVPYQGFPQVVNAMLGGQVQAGFMDHVFCCVLDVIHGPFIQLVGNFFLGTSHGTCYGLLFELAFELFDITFFHSSSFCCAFVRFTIPFSNREIYF